MKQEDLEFKTNLGYIARPCLNLIYNKDKENKKRMVIHYLLMLGDSRVLFFLCLCIFNIFHF
jgi:hypothetical protein